MLAKDPVWKKIAVSRETPGPTRQVTDQEREHLGTRAEFREVTYNTPFWKILQKGSAEDVRDWNRLDGGHGPPYFPDLEECQRCTIGATYAMSRGGGYPLHKAALVCFNKAHYLEKLQTGEADYRCG